MTIDNKAGAVKVPVSSSAATRRTFLDGAASDAGLALAGFPMFARAQSAPITLIFQSTWSMKFIYHEFAIN